jgi:hypothetical protein
MSALPSIPFPLTPAALIRCTDLFCVGTRIRFLKTLEEGPGESSPGRQYAARGELGTITGHGTREGYWAKADSWPTPFGASDDEFEVIAQNTKLSGGGALSNKTTEAESRRPLE